MSDVDEAGREAANHLLKARQILILVAQSAEEDDDPDTIEWLYARARELMELADFLHPPKPCWPSQVITVDFQARKRA